jgi:tRNA(adenine34) deaminase
MMGMKATAADEDLIQRALAEARLALAHGDIPVGAVIADENGGVIAAAHNQREALADPTAHAEMLALRAAAARRGTWRLDGLTMAVTLEPCPMCAGALALARISRLVIGAWNPDYGAVGSQWDVLRDRRLHHRPVVIGGVDEEACGTLVRDFLADQRDRDRGGDT